MEGRVRRGGQSDGIGALYTLLMVLLMKKGGCESWIVVSLVTGKGNKKEFRPILLKRIIAPLTLILAQ